jgi:transcriptional regulator with XRE-family HTH domain
MLNIHKFTYQDKRGERSRVLPGLNRSALASAVGVSRSQLSRILGGKIEPPIKTLRGLARALGASLDEVDEFLKGLRNEHERR